MQDVETGPDPGCYAHGPPHQRFVGALSADGHHDALGALPDELRLMPAEIVDKLFVYLAQMAWLVVAQFTAAAIGPGCAGARLPGTGGDLRRLPQRKHACRRDPDEGPVASMEVIKLLGTNGGSFYGVGSAHPFQSPTGLTNMLACCWSSCCRSRST
jgi:potassium-transporting ATPase A subunit